MEPNVGATDRQLRTIVGAITGVASLGILLGVISLPEILSPVLGIIALAMLATAATGTCGLYTFIGVDTCSINSGNQ